VSCSDGFLVPFSSFFQRMDNGDYLVPAMFAEGRPHFSLVWWEQKAVLMPFSSCIKPTAFPFLVNFNYSVHRLQPSPYPEFLRSLFSLPRTWRASSARMRKALRWEKQGYSERRGYACVCVCSHIPSVH
jgi:hypothetical protein